MLNKVVFLRKILQKCENINKKGIHCSNILFLEKIVKCATFELCFKIW